MDFTEPPTPYFLDPDFIARFNARLDCTSVPGCKLWTGSLVNGYGQVRTKAPLAMRKAHHVALEIKLGRRLALGKGARGRLQANHRDDLCSRKDCCNDEHLYEGTAKENHEDSVRRGTAYCLVLAARTACPRGHPYDGANSDGARFCRQCARAANDRTIARRLLGLTDAKGRGRKKLLVCIHGPEDQMRQSDGSTTCVKCRAIRRKAARERKRDGIPSAKPLI